MGADYVLTVMSRDRVGIVSGMTEAIVELDGNIDAISQTVMRGYFTIILTVHFDADVPAERLAVAARESGSPGELEVSVKERTAGPGRPVVADAERFILTVSGRDRPGIIHRITSYLASRSINIEDLYAYSEGEEFLLTAQLEVPPGPEVERLQMDVESLWPAGEMTVALQHENVFLATNHVDFRQEV
ncbi:MAG: ACT domain-containing protein [Candidatus Brocadiia bacterium]